MAFFNFNPLQTVMPSAAPTPGQSQRASPEAFGADIGRAMQGAGEALSQAGDVASRHALAFQELNNETYAKQADTALQTKLRNMGYGDPADTSKPGYFALAGQAAFDGSKPTMEAADKAFDEVSDSLPNDAARRMFYASGKSRVASFSESVASHAAQGRKEWMIGTSQARQASAIDSAADYYNDPTKINLNIALAKQEALDQGEIQGWSPEQVTAAQRDVASKAHVAVIDRMMTDNPLAAQKYYQDHIDDISGQSHAVVEKALKSAVTPVLTRQGADMIMNGAPMPNPRVVDEAMKGPLPEAVAMAESGNKDTALDGSIITSPKGAQGKMQVMPDTQRSPGFGIEPAKDDSAEEKNRVGRDYLSAMLSRYGNQSVALAAYNWGPAKVDAVLQRMGAAPGQSGQIDEAAFAAKLPPETQAYVQRVNDAAPQTPPSPPTSTDVRANLGAWMSKAREVAPLMFPNNPAAQDQMVSNIEAKSSEIVRGQNYADHDARNTLMSLAMGLTKTVTGDYTQLPATQRPSSLDALLTTPAAKSAWATMEPDQQAGILGIIKQNAAGTNPPMTDAAMSKFYELKGQAANDPEAFMSAKLSDPSITDLLPHEQTLELINLQTSLMTKQNRDAIKGMNLSHALTTAKPMLLASGIAPPSKPGEKAAVYDQFVGRLSTQIDAFAAANNRQPKDDEIRKMTGTLLAQGTEKNSGWIWDKSVHLFQTDPAKFAAKVPDEEMPQIKAAFAARYHRLPSPGEVQDIYTAHILRTGGAGR